MKNSSLKIVILFLLINPILLFASVSNEEHGFNIKAFVFALINFSIFVGVIFYFTKKKIIQGLKDRSLKIKKEIETATKLKQEALEKFEEYDSKLSYIETEINKISQDSENDGLLFKERLAQEGDKIAKKIISDVESSCENELAKAKLAIKAEILRLAEASVIDKMTKDSKASDEDIMNLLNKEKLFDNK
ncbi:MAG: ATP synthase F0 subunit B [Pseudomonadota bacterium]